MAGEDRVRQREEPITFYKRMLQLLERGAIGDVEKVKSNLLRRIKLAMEQRAKRRKR